MQSLKDFVDDSVTTEEVAKIWVIVVVLSEHRQRNGRGCRGWWRVGLSTGVYRSDLSLDLKQFSNSAVTISWGSPFQSGMILGKNDICLYRVLQDGMS